MAKFKTGDSILYKGECAIINKQINLFTVNPQIYPKGTIGYDVVTSDGIHHICINEDEQYILLAYRQEPGK